MLGKCSSKDRTVKQRKSVCTRDFCGPCHPCNSRPESRDSTFNTFLHRPSISACPSTPFQLSAREYPAATSFPLPSLHAKRLSILSQWREGGLRELQLVAAHLLGQLHPNKTPTTIWSMPQIPQRRPLHQRKMLKRRRKNLRRRRLPQSPRHHQWYSRFLVRSVLVARRRIGLRTGM